VAFPALIAPSSSTAISLYVRIEERSSPTWNGRAILTGSAEGHHALAFGGLAERIDGHGAALVALTLSASSDSVTVIPKFHGQGRYRFRHVIVNTTARVDEAASASVWVS
jgi:hypothetical protein